MCLAASAAATCIGKLKETFLASHREGTPFAPYGVSALHTRHEIRSRHLPSVSSKRLQRHDFGCDKRPHHRANGASSEDDQQPAGGRQDSPATSEVFFGNASRNDQFTSVESTQLGASSAPAAKPWCEGIVPNPVLISRRSLNTHLRSAENSSRGTARGSRYLFTTPYTAGASLGITATAQFNGHHSAVPSVDHLTPRVQHQGFGRVRPPLLLSANPSRVVTRGPAGVHRELDPFMHAVRV